MAAQQELFDLELHEDGAALEEDIGDDAIDMNGLVRNKVVDILLENTRTYTNV